jgi:phage terminase Nu1 subunit (DNA packaging protein)
MSGETTQQQRDENWRQGSDVYQHTYAFHHAVLPTAKRSPDADDEADALYYYARVNEAADRKLAQALRAGAARIRALETIVFAMHKSKCTTEGNCE